MATFTTYAIKNWLQHHPNPGYRRLFQLLKTVRSMDIPTPRLWNRFLYITITGIRSLLSSLGRVLIYTPAFKGRLDSCGKGLYLYTGLPFISGPLYIQVGDRCRISGQTTFSGRSSGQKPELIIGNNVGIGWQTTIAVGQKVIIEDNVRIAGKAFLFGYSGHPLDAQARAEGQPDSESQVSNIHLQKDVWLGSNVSVSAGVTIGEGTIVATGSVVTKDLPPFVLAGGNPARVVRSVRNEQHQATQSQTGDSYA